MPRVTTPAMEAGVTAGVLWPAFFLQIGFISETVYMWSGRGTFVWNGNTYEGVGSLLGFQDDKGGGTIEEGSTAEARGIVITLSGFDAVALAEFLSDYKVGQSVAVYLGLFLDSSRIALIESPVCVWAGETDQATTDFSGVTATVAMACENVLNEMNVAADRRRTFDDMQWQTPGDLGFQFIAALAEKTIYWGTVPSNKAQNVP